MPGPRKKKIRLQPGAPEVEGTVMTFQPVLENFNEYFVDDGTVINIKLVVAEIIKLDDAWNDQGEPVYLINSTNVTSVSVPDHLRKQEGGENQ